MHRPALLLLLALLLTGCQAVMPAMQVVGAVKTGYDVHEIVRPQDRVDFGHAPDTDAVVEARVRSRLDRAGDFLSVTPHALDGHVYLVGLFRDKGEAQAALDAVRGVDGVRRVTGVFYLENRQLPYDPDGDLRAALRLRDRIVESGAVKTATLRINVVQRRAVLLGRVGSVKEKARILAAARQADTAAGIHGLDDYLEVSPR